MRKWIFEVLEMKCIKNTIYLNDIILSLKGEREISLVIFLLYCLTLDGFAFQTYFFSKLSKLFFTCAIYYNWKLLYFHVWGGFFTLFSIFCYLHFFSFFFFKLLLFVFISFFIYIIKYIERERKKKNVCRQQQQQQQHFAVSLYCACNTIHV